MIVDRNIKALSIFSEETIVAALRKIDENQNGFVFGVDASGRLEGMLTDGDVRRWLTRETRIDLDAPVSMVANATVTSAPISSTPDYLRSLFSQRIKVIPLVDDRGVLMAVARLTAGGFQIGPYVLGRDAPAFIIAEIGNNHNGDMDLAHRLIDAAKASGADCAKFQMRDMHSLYHTAKDAGMETQDLGTQYTLDLLARVNLAPENLFRLFDYCNQVGILPLCTPWDPPSLAALESYGMVAYKVASADLTNHHLLRLVADTGKPMILSTGMSTEQEIKKAIGVLRGQGASYALLHCNSTYPAPFKDVNLRYMSRLEELGQCLVGYSGHERGINVAVAAISRGAKIIEKHFTLDRSMEGTDHKASLLPEEFATLVVAVREVEQALGTTRTRGLSQGEMMNREVLGKSLYARRAIPMGTPIREEMVVIRSPGRGLAPTRLPDLLGRVLGRDMAAGDAFQPTDVGDPLTRPRAYAFALPWGLPVRYHDYRRFLDQSNPDLLEYHLSHRDMGLDPADWFDGRLSVGFTLHAPELFAGDHLLDLAAEDPDYLARSRQEMQRVIDLARQLREYHRVTAPPLIITNVGGFSSRTPLPPDARPALYERVAESLAGLEEEGVEVIIQTMPPFPWHFGGQQYHNLFVDPDEIADFCTATGRRICLDVSHSQLACTNAGWSMATFVRRVMPHVAHLHLADAQGVDGEGLQIGTGGLDFTTLAELVLQSGLTPSFIPEVWQGHKDDGAGFWMALEKLEAWFGHPATAMATARTAGKSTVLQVVHD